MRNNTEGNPPQTNTNTTLVNNIPCIDLSRPAVQRTRGHSLQIPFIGTRGPAGVFTSQDQAHYKHSGLFAFGNLQRFSHGCTLTPAWHLFGVSRERGAKLHNWSNSTLQIQQHTRMHWRQSGKTPPQLLTEPPTPHCSSSRGRPAPPKLQSKSLHTTDPVYLM